MIKEKEVLPLIFSSHPLHCCHPLVAISANSAKSTCPINYLLYDLPFMAISKKN